jgi:hypothetical protein
MPGTILAQPGVTMEIFDFLLGLWVERLNEEMEKSNG